MSVKDKMAAVCPYMTFLIFLFSSIQETLPNSMTPRSYINGAVTERSSLYRQTNDSGEQNKNSRPGRLEQQLMDMTTGWEPVIAGKETVRDRGER